jgi:hypothetical protein
MGSIFKRSLYLALLWRAIVAVAVVSAALMLAPRWWVAVLVGFFAAAWVAWRGGRFITNAIEALEPAAASLYEPGVPAARGFGGGRSAVGCEHGEPS